MPDCEEPRTVLEMDGFWLLTVQQILVVLLVCSGVVLLLENTKKTTEGVDIPGISFSNQTGAPHKWE